MPAAFDKAYQKGGKVRTVTLPGGRYMHVVEDPRTGKWIRGEIKKKETRK